MSGAPDVDYTATSLRPDWNTLPPALHESLAVALGTEITAAGPPVGSGFTGGFAASVHLADGRRVFVKAADDTMHAYHAYQREAEVVPQLPAAIRVPPIIATAHAVERVGEGGPRWFAVVSEWVEGRMPGAPWTADDFAVVTAMCERIAVAMEPSPLEGLHAFIQDLEGDESPLQIPGQIVAGERPLPDRLQPWVPRILPELADLVQLAPEAFAGEAATHGDLRPDNLLLDATGTCWTVDWNWLALGPRWMDWVGLLPVAQHQGIDTAAAIHGSPLTADVPPEHLDCFAGVIAAYMMRNADAPPPLGCTPALREHQRFYAWTFLDWLAVRRGW
ncbi:phosphotransferase family protein [Kribbella sp. NBC_00359]|uniref:phosphotransferase family protein n=1 Tax=Kribbella sp. NBC_00359 TaxID=2975966 RepID=UPI002E249102